MMEKKTKLLWKILLIFIILLVIPHTIMAKGNADYDKDYEKKLQVSTDQICTALEAKTMTAAQAKTELSELRLQYRMEYTDESGKMDSIIDDLANGVITREQARVRFEKLAELKLQERKQEELKIQEKKQNKTNSPDVDSKPDPSPDPDPDPSTDSKKEPNSSSNANKNGSGGN